MQDSPSPSSSSDSRKAIDTVTIEGQRQVKRQIDAFVYGVLVTYLNDSLMRWGAPICPMIGGLPGDQGEYVAARLSEVARDVHAPLAEPGKPCHPNLIVAVTDDPDSVAEHWVKHDSAIPATDWIVTAVSPHAAGDDSLSHDSPAGVSSSTPRKSSSSPNSRGPNTFRHSERRMMGAALYPITRTRWP
jgi:hypothetical protein